MEAFSRRRQAYRQTDRQNRQNRQNRLAGTAGLEFWMLVQGCGPAVQQSSSLRSRPNSGVRANRDGVEDRSPKPPRTPRLPCKALK